jgi:hypothetical protein
MHDSISPHPDCETMSTSELNAALADADERLRILHELRTDADPLVETWLVQERRVILAELNRRKGHWNGDKHAETEQPASDEVPVLPSEAWSGLFGAYRNLVGSSTEAPDAYHWAVFLVSVGLLLGHNVWLNNPHPLRPNFFAALIGKTGTSRKSTALRFGEVLFEKIGHDIQILPGVVSSEGIYQKLAENEGTRLLIAADEFRGLMEIARRQSTRDLIPKLNSLYNCPKFDGINRRKEPVAVIRPFTSLITASPLAWIHESIAAGHVTGGFLNRFLFIEGEEKRPIPFPESPSDANWNCLISQLQPVIKSWQDKPGPMGWSLEARELYEKFYSPWKIRQKSLADNISDLTNRIPDHVLKIAIVYSALERRTTISPVALAIAIAIGGYLEKMTQRLFGSLSLTRIGKVEKLICDRLQVKRGIMVLRDLRQSFGSRVETEDFNRAILSLERAEIITVIPEPTAAGRETKIVTLLVDQQTANT